MEDSADHLIVASDMLSSVTSLFGRQVEGRTKWLADEAAAAASGDQARPVERSRALVELALESWHELADRYGTFSTAARRSQEAHGASDDPGPQIAAVRAMATLAVACAAAQLGFVLSVDREPAFQPVLDRAVTVARAIAPEPALDPLREWIEAGAGLFEGHDAEDGSKRQSGGVHALLQDRLRLQAERLKLLALLVGDAQRALEQAAPRSLPRTG